MDEKPKTTEGAEGAPEDAASTTPAPEAAAQESAPAEQAAPAETPSITLDQLTQAASTAAAEKADEVEGESVEVVATDGAVEAVEATGVAETVAPAMAASDPAASAAAAQATAPAAATAAAPAGAGTVPPADGATPGAAAPAAAPGAPVAAPGAPLPSATGALVCGILAIVLAGIPIVGIILGILAIVLAGRYYKMGGTAGTGKGARICGIIGIVLAVVIFIAGLTIATMALLAPTQPSSSSFTTSSGTTLTYDEDEAGAEAVGMRLQLIADRDPEMIATITAMAADSFEDEFDWTMEECGIDPAEFVDLMLTDFSYTFNSFEGDASRAGTTGEAVYIISCRDIIDVSHRFSDAVEEASDNGSLDGMGNAERKAFLGTTLMNALREGAITHSGYFDIDMVNQGGVWVIDEDSWDDDIEYFFTLS